MRFLTTLFCTASMFVFASAQNATMVESAPAQVVPTTVSPIAVSSTVSLSPAQSSQAACLSECPANDPACRAACVRGDALTGQFDRQNATINCVASCDHGDGSAAENLQYQDCLKGCVASATITPASTAPTETGSATATGDSVENGPNHAMTTTATGTESNAFATGTSTASSSKDSKGAADNLRAGTSLVGVLGIFVAVFAL